MKEQISPDAKLQQASAEPESFGEHWEYVKVYINGVGGLVVIGQDKEFRELVFGCLHACNGLQLPENVREGLLNELLLTATKASEVMSAYRSTAEEDDEYNNDDVIEAQDSLDEVLKELKPVVEPSKEQTK